MATGLGEAGLPPTLTSFVGRALEIAQISELLDGARVVTLTGPGGVGKTRLSLEVARRFEADGGAVFVDLARVDGDVGGALVQALGAPRGPDEPGVDAAVRALGTRRVCVVLDNCEHVLEDSCRTVEALVLGCPAVTVLATSREPLRSGAEQLFVVPALSLDRGQGEPEAVRLFLDRARRVAPGMVPPDLDLVAELCRRVDGLALGIELAAARVAALPLTEILASLYGGDGLLSDGPRTAPARQASVRASLAWSYQLLNEAEQRALRVLSVFRGPFRLPAAQAVLADDAIEPGQVLPLLASLVSKSLVAMEPSQHGARYGLLTLVRGFAAEQLEPRVEEGREARDRHLAFFLGDAERIEPVFEGQDLTHWIAQLQADLPDLRSAVAWAVEQGEADHALRLVGALWRFWWAGGRGDGRDLVRVALDVPGGSPAARTKALVAGVLAASARFDFVGAVELGEAAVRESRDTGDPALQARAACWLGWMLGTFDPVGARPHLDEAIAGARTASDLTVLADALNGLAAVEVRSGDLSTGASRLAEVLALTDASGNRITRCHAKTMEAFVRLSTGNLPDTLEAVAEALPTAQAVGDAVYLVMLLNTRAWVHALLRQDEEAAAAGHAALDVGTSTGDGLIASAAEAGRGVAAFTAGDLSSARSCLAAAFPGLSLVAAPMAVQVAGLLAQVSAEVGDDEQARAWAERSLALATELGSDWARSHGLLATGRLAASTGQDHAAWAAVHEALELSWAAGDELTTVHALEVLSRARLGIDGAGAVRVAAAADAARDRSGFARSEVDRRLWTEFLTEAAAALGPELEGCLVAGRGLMLHEAVALEGKRRGPRNRPTVGWAALTPAEARVVELVAQGLSNPDIAGRLFVSRDTVKGHVSAALAKTGTSTRAELAAEASRRERSTPDR